MKLLAIESSGGIASAAIIEDGQVLIEKTGPFKVTHSETLMPLISECFNEMSMEPKEIDLIAVSGGPGSFTGLRIGSATAKGLGFALKKDLVHVPTLEGMAYGFKDSSDFIVPLMDARRGQVYTGVYYFENGKMEEVLEQCAMSYEEIVEKINDIAGDGTAVTFLGDGLEGAKPVIEANAAFAYSYADDEMLYQKASSVGLLGYEYALAGRIVSADEEAPEYLRPSQAERVRAEQGAN